VTRAPAHAVRRLKDAGRHSVWLIQGPDGQPRTFKSWPLTPSMLLKLALGLAQPQRQARGAQRVAAAGVCTARVHGWRVAWSRRRVEMELAWLPGRSAAELVSPLVLDEAACRAVSAAAGDIVRRLVEADLFDRDLKLANLVVDRDREPVTVGLIDTVGVRRLRRPEVEIARMLERLVEKAAGATDLTPPMWVPGLRRSLAGLPAATRRAVVARLKARRSRGSG
jgi:hypothetical protein